MDRVFLIVFETNLLDRRELPEFAVVLGNDIPSSYALGTNIRSVLHSV